MQADVGAKPTCILRYALILGERSTKNNCIVGGVLDFGMPFRPPRPR